MDVLRRDMRRLLREENIRSAVQDVLSERPSDADLDRCRDRMEHTVRVEDDSYTVRRVHSS